MFIKDQHPQHVSGRDHLAKHPQSGGNSLKWSVKPSTDASGQQLGTIDGSSALAVPRSTSTTVLFATLHAKGRLTTAIAWQTFLRMMADAGILVETNCGSPHSFMAED